MNDMLCMMRPTALVIAAFVIVSPACAQSTDGDTVTSLSDSGTLIAERVAAAETKSLKFRLKVDMDAHPTERFFPDLWPNQNLPVQKKVDKVLVNELAQIKANVRIPSSAAVLVPGGATTKP